MFWFARLERQSTPASVPPVPQAQMKPSTSPPSSSYNLVGPVVSICASRLAEIVELEWPKCAFRALSRQSVGRGGRKASRNYWDWRKDGGHFDKPELLAGDNVSFFSCDCVSGMTMTV